MARPFAFIFCIVVALLLCIATANAGGPKIQPDTRDYSHLQKIVFNITDDTANLLDDGIWFIDVYAEWCGHCQQFKPSLMDAAEELLKQKHDAYLGKVKIAMINGPENPNLRSRFVTRGYPTLALLKNGQKSEYKGLRSKEAVLHELTNFAQPDVRQLENRGHFKQALGGIGQWNNLFIYLGPNHASHGGFIECAKRHADRAHFYSPYGMTEPQMYKLIQSIWDTYPGEWDRIWEVSTITEKQSFDDLVDFFKIDQGALPVVINFPVGRDLRVYQGPFAAQSEKEMLCEFIEANIANPIEQLSTFNYQPILEDAESYVLLAVHENNAADIDQLSVLPPLAERFGVYYDRFSWTLSPLIPKLKQHFGIPYNMMNFMLVVDKSDEVEKFWVISDEYFQSEDTLFDYFKGIRNGTIIGQGLYHPFNPLPRLARKMNHFIASFTDNTQFFWLCVALATLIVGFLLGLIYICFFTPDESTQLDELKAQQAALQEKLAGHNKNADAATEKKAKDEPFIDSSRAAKIPAKPKLD